MLVKRTDSNMGRRDSKYVAKELARHMQKPRKVVMEMLLSSGRYLRSKNLRYHCGCRFSESSARGVHRHRLAGLSRYAKEHAGIDVDMERTFFGYGAVDFGRGSSAKFCRGRAQGGDRERSRDGVRGGVVDAVGRGGGGEDCVDRSFGAQVHPHGTRAHTFRSIWRRRSYTCRRRRDQASLR